MNRAELQRLAMERVSDVKALLDARRWSAAYYLAGYAIECALKACVLAYVERTGVIFKDKKYAEQCWTHNLKELMRLADIKASFDAAAAADADLQANWDIVKDWTEASRYARTTKVDVEELYSAVSDKKHGVLTWIKGCW